MSATAAPPQPPQQPAPQPAPQQQAPRQCPRCGAALAPGQDWCLECGTAVSTRIAPAPNWRAPLIIAGVVLVLAAAGIAFALFEAFGSPGETTIATTPPAAPAPTPPAPTPPATTGPTGPTAGTTGPTGPTAGLTGPTGPTAGATGPTGVSGPTGPNADDVGGAAGQVGSWPEGEEAYTVVLQSSDSRANAESFARSLAEKGVSVGVLDSSKFSSLRPGYWVVFSGQYETEEEALSEAEALQSDAPGAYPRLVRP